MKVAEMYSMAIHGGGVWRDKMRASEADYLESLKIIIEQGQKMAEAGKKAVDIVQTLTVMLEDEPLYKAGKGSIGKKGQTVTMDAALMDGIDGKYGATTTLRNVKNPVLLARYIMDERTENMIVGPGAEEIAKKIGLSFEDDNYFCVKPRPGPNEMGTVGAVARDVYGNLACATSTGGFPGHKVSEWRVGDSPLIAGGTFADNRSCAISCCGHGERFISAGVTRRIAGRIEFLDETTPTAVSKTLSELPENVIGGIICIDKNGNFGVQTTSKFIMACATLSKKNHLIVFC